MKKNTFQFEPDWRKSIRKMSTWIGPKRRLEWHIPLPKEYVGSHEPTYAVQRRNRRDSNEKINCHTMNESGSELQKVDLPENGIFQAQRQKVLIYELWKASSK